MSLSIGEPDVELSRVLSTCHLFALAVLSLA